MIRHLVFWKLKTSSVQEKQQQAQEIKTLLEALAGKIPGLVSIEVGVDFSASEQSADVALMSVHTDRAALEAYQAHPEHQACLPVIRSLISERRVVDYEF